MSVLFAALLMCSVADTSFPYAVRQTTSFNWKHYELKVDERYKDSVLQSMKKNYAYYFNNDYADAKAYPKSFHFVNLNGDALPDLVYQGWSGAEGDRVQFYLNRRHKMDQVFDGFQHVLYMRFADNKLKEFVLFNPGCCAENVLLEQHYTVDASMHSKLVLQRAILIGMSVFDKQYIKPDDFFEQPFSFKTVNAGYALRYTPEFSNDPPGIPDADSSNKGNIIALYPKGSKGKAWGYKKDKTGREWWLVEMNPASKLPFSQYRLQYEIPTHFFGWMSSRFLEKLAGH
jgi:hypothetical protein